MTAINLLSVMLLLTIIAALVQKYRFTRDPGFLWLGLPLVALLLLNYPLSNLVDRVARGEQVGFFPFTLVERGTMTLGWLVGLLASAQHLVSLALFLVAILMLHKARPSEPSVRNS